MADTGFAEYLIPLQSREWDEVSEADSEFSENEEDSEDLSVFQTYDENKLEDAIKTTSEKRLKEIKDKVEEKKDLEVFKQHLFEYRRFVARREHLKLRPDIIRRRVLDYALLRSSLCENDAVSFAWAYVLKNYNDELGPDFLFLSECYAAVDGMLDALERFTFFGI